MLTHERVTKKRREKKCSAVQCSAVRVKLERTVHAGTKGRRGLENYSTVLRSWQPSFRRQSPSPRLLASRCTAVGNMVLVAGATRSQRSSTTQYSTGTMEMAGLVSYLVNGLRCARRDHLQTAAADASQSPLPLAESGGPAEGAAGTQFRFLDAIFWLHFQVKSCVTRRRSGIMYQVRALVGSR